jgi:hypothetical protein
MADATPESTYRGLPLSSEQDAQIKHYIKKRLHNQMPWDTPELTGMIDDMLCPPQSEDLILGTTFDNTRSASERADASIDDAMEPVEASEERNAAMETEGMRHRR